MDKVPRRVPYWQGALVEAGAQSIGRLPLGSCEGRHSTGTRYIRAAKS